MESSQSQTIMSSQNASGEQNLGNDSQNQAPPGVNTRVGVRGLNWSSEMKKNLAELFTKYAEDLGFNNPNVRTEADRYNGNEVYF